ncbi:MAG: hypothetical protein HKN67_11465 [Saprospiraceae bacterium]|nr:hypothetical protein [Bacteroidia bacterium]NNF22550.1 hypothetical protein [Saprospiraceae bacterium]
MEDWELDFHWLELRHKMQSVTGSPVLPDLKAILFLIGVQEYGRVNKSFTKEEKRDLMHIAACSLLEKDGFYTFAGRDGDGWPHWEISKPFNVKGIKEQETILKKNIIEYFEKLD